MKSTLFILFLFVGTLFLQGQEIKSITKAEILIKIAENNTTIKISEEEFNEWVDPKKMC